MNTTVRKIWVIAFAAFIFVPFHPCNAQSTSKDSAAALYRILAIKDSLVYDDILNTCNFNELSSILAPDFQFLQDNGGPKYTGVVGRDRFINDFKSYCSKNNNPAAMKKVRRVVAGTLQAYTTGENTAIQMGVQNYFLTKAGQPDLLVDVSRFINTWTLKNGEWKMTRQFISLENFHAPHTDSLYATIEGLDAKLFDAINHKDLATLKDMYDESLEFYHDKSGLMDYKTSMEINERHFKDTAAKYVERRELDKNSLEVFPIPGFGAIEVGMHRFYTSFNGGPEEVTASPRFVLVWQQKGNQWKVVKVVSYGH
ncbi:nuclear transport factor 2 family protein [Chitinophaga silvisoli]|uniref:Nuclear transport factor 2 family protein n=1 Tax=Chitinophaga silvisoli TaxID=2291814 RepID=A0A3E1NN56_9BACT|nr:nuclear transport factor 2 family protein [Chitinophaga silvisoli]RFM29366.1 nuclear transport factor 2 family protein [Chitinophaga silvisoli]